MKMSLSSFITIGSKKNLIHCRFSSHWTDVFQSNNLYSLLSGKYITSKYPLHAYLMVGLLLLLMGLNLQFQNFLAGTERHGERLQLYEYFLCGTYTGFAASFIEGPMDLVSWVIF